MFGWCISAQVMTECAVLWGRSVERNGFRIKTNRKCNVHQRKSMVNKNAVKRHFGSNCTVRLFWVLSGWSISTCQRASVILPRKQISTLTSNDSKSLKYLEVTISRNHFWSKNIHKTILKKRRLSFHTPRLKSLWIPHHLERLAYLSLSFLIPYCFSLVSH